MLTGEYAVLLGAPALVLAVNRQASATLITLKEGGWTINSSNFQSMTFDNLNTLLESCELNLIRELIRSLPDKTALPKHAKLILNSDSFYLEGQKLGIGSSAAILVALAELLTHITQHRFTHQELIDLHNSLQKSQGSGLDVVASLVGGLTRFQNGTAVRVSFPAGLHMRFAFSGASAQTGSMIARFNTIVRSSKKTELATWKRLATNTVAAIHDLQTFLTNLTALNEFVFNFDQETGLGIYTEPHQTALAIAKRTGVMYKPCGAGGGDTGVALSDDPGLLDIFERSIVQEGLSVLELKVEHHGATVQI